MYKTNYELTFDEINVTLPPVDPLGEQSFNYLLQVTDSVEAKLRHRGRVPKSKPFDEVYVEVHHVEKWIVGYGLTVFAKDPPNSRYLRSIYKVNLTEREEKCFIIRVQELRATLLQASAAKIRKECGLPA